MAIILGTRGHQRKARFVSQVHWIQVLARFVLVRREVGFIHCYKPAARAAVGSSQTRLGNGLNQGCGWTMHVQFTVLRMCYPAARPGVSPHLTSVLTCTAGKSPTQP